MTFRGAGARGLDGPVAARAGFEVKPQRAGFVLLLLFVGLAFRFVSRFAGQRHQEQQQPEIDIEWTEPYLHNFARQSNCLGNVKTDMSKQSNKVEKRQRRERYLKRKHAAVKAKQARATTAPPAAAPPMTTDVPAEAPAPATPVAA